jgi:hypothetical protein
MAQRVLPFPSLGLVLLGFFLWPALSAQQAHGERIYVNNVLGQDGYDGSAVRPLNERQGPVATLSRALQLARAGDVIELAVTDRAYTGLYVDRPGLGGTPRHPIVVEGKGAVIRGLKEVPHDAWILVAEGVYRLTTWRKAYYQLFCNGQPARRVEPRFPKDGKIPILAPLQWTALGGDIYFRVEDQKYIGDYRLEIPGEEFGISLYEVRHLVLRNLVVEGFRLDGVHVFGNSEGVTLENVTSRFHGRSGLAVGGASAVQATGCTFQGNYFADLYSYGAGKLTATDCKLLGGGVFGAYARSGQIRLKQSTVGSFLRAAYEQGAGIVVVEQKQQ